jgi:hypothetical protein
MNQSLQPQPRIAEVLTGVFMLGLLMVDYLYSHPMKLSELINQGTATLVVGTGVFLLLSWIAGTFFEACRNLLETRWDKLAGKVHWNFFYEGEREKVAQLENYYFAYYTLAANYAIAISWFGIVKLALWLWPSAWPHYYLLFPGLVAVAAVYFLEARSLRQEIQFLLHDGTLPHVGAYTRLRTSKIDGVAKKGGVGVFAIREIPEGTNIFASDAGEMIEQDPKILDGLDPELRRLYEDFCVFKKGKLLCPRNFNNLTVGWYLNHSEEPNARCDNEYNFIAIRHIQAGEEITANYGTYGELLPGRRSFTE